MSKKNQHVVPHGNKWGVGGEGNERLTYLTPHSLKPSTWQETSQKISKVNYLFTTGRVRSVSVTAMEMILSTEGLIALLI